MPEIVIADENLIPFWTSLDRHISAEELKNIMGLKRCAVIKEKGEPLGIMRWGLFWDEIPFLNLIFIKEGHRRRGLGRAFMDYFESTMRNNGFKVVMTSTRSDEQAQHFYRHLGYKDTGSLILEDQPTEIILIKHLNLSI